MRIVLVFFISFIWSTIFAASFDVACVSQMSDVQYNGESFKNGIYITAGCYEMSSIFGAKQKAQDECQKWANYYGIEDFEAKVYDKSKDNFTSCSYDIKTIRTNLLRKKLNQIHEVGSVYKESDTIFYYTNLFIDNHNNPKAVYEKSSGRELAQWLRLSGEFYCGKLDQDLAFRYNAKDSELIVIQISSKKKAIYRQVLIGEFKLVTSQNSINSPLLNWNISQNNMSYIDFYQLANGKKIVQRHEEILYSENNFLCR